MKLVRNICRNALLLKSFRQIRCQRVTSLKLFMESIDCTKQLIQIYFLFSHNFHEFPIFIHIFVQTRVNFSKMQFFIETSFFGISVIAGYGGTRQVIRKTVEGDDLFEKVQLKDLISEDEQARVLIQMTNGLFS